MTTRECLMTAEMWKWQPDQITRYAQEHGCLSNSNSIMSNINIWFVLGIALGICLALIIMIVMQCRRNDD